MSSRRKFSRRGYDVKLARRPELEIAIANAVEDIIRKHEPTAHMPAVRSAAKLAGIIGSYLATQKQVVQRALKIVEPKIDEIGIHFVSDIVTSATQGLQKSVEKFDAAIPARIDDQELNIVVDWAGKVAGPSFIERHFGIPRSTLYRWQKRSEVVWLQSRTSRKPVFPLRQFKNGRPIDGIPELIALFGDPSKAWEWCDPDNENGPLADLLEGRLDKVLDDARQHINDILPDPTLPA